MNFRSLFNKLLLLFFVVLILSFTVTFLFVRGSIYTSALNKNIEILQQHIHYIAQARQQNSPDFLSNYARHFGIRLTVIQLNGLVVYDSQQDPAKMENHLKRPEVQAALHGAEHAYRRFSHTLHKHMVYVAMLQGQRVVRASIPTDNITSQIRDVLVQLLIFYCLVFIILTIIVYKLIVYLSQPLRNLIRTVETFSRKYQIKHMKTSEKDEVEVLTHSFEELLNKISQNIDQLKKLETVRSEFVANVSHELRTPITSIMACIETLETGALEDSTHNRRFLSMMKNNIHRLNHLVKDILTLAKIENEDTAIERVNIVDFLTALFRDQNLNENPRFRIDVGIKIFWIEINPDELYSAMLNYINNALRYSTTGAIYLSLKASDNHVEFSVKDNGPGIASEHHSRLFERFYRPDKNRARDAGGTGLGLAIVKHVIEKYGGIVGLESEIGKGSRFWFVLPRANSQIFVTKSS